MMQEQVVRGARWKALLVVAGSIGFVALCVRLLGHPDAFARLVAVFGAGFFGLCGVVGVVRLVRPVRLVLRTEGFRIEQPPFRPKTVAWSDVEDFYIWSHRGTRLVAFAYRPGRGTGSALEQVNRALGAEGFVPSGLRLAPKDLLALMQEWKARAERS